HDPVQPRPRAACSRRQPRRDRDRGGATARAPVPFGDRPADGGPPVPGERPCQPRRSDGDPAALFFQQCARRPGANGGAPEIAELDPPDGDAAELPGDEAASSMTAVPVLQFISVILTALSFVPSGAHLSELVNKIALPAPQYFAVQSIYRG